MSPATLTSPRRPALALPADLCVGLVTAAGGVWFAGAAWSGPASLRAVGALAGAGLVLMGAWWTAGGVRAAR